MYGPFIYTGVHTRAVRSSCRRSGPWKERRNKAGVGKTEKGKDEGGGVRDGITDISRIESSPFIRTIPLVLFSFPLSFSLSLSLSLSLCVDYRSRRVATSDGASLLLLVYRNADKKVHGSAILSFPAL